MKRFVWGLVLLAFGGVAMLGSLVDPSPRGNPQGFVGGIVFAVIGGALTYFGHQYLQRKKQVTETALQMLRKMDKIDAAELASQTSLSEVDVRQYLAESQRQGVLPIKAEIV